MAHDLVVTGGTIVDGTGAAPRRGDIGVDGDRITAIVEGGHETKSGSHFFISPASPKKKYRAFESNIIHRH